MLKKHLFELMPVSYSSFVDPRPSYTNKVMSHVFLARDSGVLRPYEADVATIDPLKDTFRFEAWAWGSNVWNNLMPPNVLRVNSECRVLGEFDDLDSLKSAMKDREIRKKKCKWMHRAEGVHFPVRNHFCRAHKVIMIERGDDGIRIDLSPSVYTFSAPSAP